ncbi:MAG: hypothetical protein H8D74_01125 [Chloroflexi bacterium]|nr:hypothetical protein [Chloroflexota bacterium]
MTTHIITVRQDLDLIVALNALGIPSTRHHNGQGKHLMTITLNDDTDRRLLNLWTLITDLRFRYIEAQQRNQPIQLHMPITTEPGQTAANKDKQLLLQIKEGYG